MKRSLLLSLFLLTAALGLTAADVRLAALFADGMVLQRGEPIPVWGWGTKGETVEATLAGHTRKTTVRPDGTWSLTLPKLPAGGPYTLTVGDKTLRDVLVGDVFLFSGQSNMELPVSRCMDSVAHVVRGYANESVRYLKIPPQYDYIQPRHDMKTLGWKAITPASTPEMGAVCYFAARYLQEAEGVPVGIINSSVGGTGVEAWMTRETLRRHQRFAQELQGEKFRDPDWPDKTRQREGRAMAAWRQRAGSDRRPEAAAFHATDLFARWATGDGGHIYGTYWFRRTVRLTASQAQQGAILHLGAMKDADSTFVNGHCVGVTPYEYPPRNYTVPAGTLREGDNEILVRLTAEGGYPNFTRGKVYALDLGRESLDLTGGWTMARGTTMENAPQQTYFVNTPTALYNAMIAPLGQLPLRAIVWYQGENNTAMSRTEYAALLSDLVADWHRQTGHRVPVVAVQLAGYMQRHESEPQAQSGWCDIRLAQRDVALAYGGLATAIDLGEANDIHPQQKNKLGQRVALQLRRLVYGWKGVAEGPKPLRARLKAQRLEVNFDTHTGTLQAHGTVRVALSDGSNRWQWADAHITGPHTLAVDLPQGLTPTLLRYAYDDFPLTTLYNNEGLPAPTFELQVK